MIALCDDQMMLSALYETAAHDRNRIDISAGAKHKQTNRLLPQRLLGTSAQLAGKVRANFAALYRIGTNGPRTGISARSAVFGGITAAGRPRFCYEITYMSS